MIDTDKYEETLEDRMNKEFCNDIAGGDMYKDLAIQYAHEFYGNALELLAEVKRLRDELDTIKSHRSFEHRFSPTGYGMAIQAWIGLTESGNGLWS